MNAKMNLKRTVKDWASKKRALRAELRDLKSKGPETGAERCQLWQDYNQIGRRYARGAHLAYGLMRGRSYHQIEQKCRESLDPYLVLKTLQQAGIDTWKMDDIITWIDPKAAEVAA